jgi:serine/threonine protein kinase
VAKSTADVQAVLPNGLVLQAELHQGGQRQVFEADANGRHCVLKLMPAAERARAEREVAVGYGRNHPNLAEILDASVTDVSIGGDDYVYFTEEFVDGDPVAAIIGAVDACETLKVMSDLAAAVEHLWTQDRVVHRDIKPLNMIRKPDGTFVLLDVGIGRHQLESSLTNPWGMLGSPGYFAPEQMIPSRRRTLDFRADLFLIGIVAFQLLTGHLPFDPVALDYPAHVQTGVTGALLNRVPPELRTLFRRLLAARPHQRFARFDLLRDEIATAWGALGCT